MRLSTAVVLGVLAVALVVAAPILGGGIGATCVIVGVFLGTHVAVQRSFPKTQHLAESESTNV